MKLAKERGKIKNLGNGMVGYSDRFEDELRFFKEQDVPSEVTLAACRVHDNARLAFTSALSLCARYFGDEEVSPEQVIQLAMQLQGLMRSEQRQIERKSKRIYQEEDE